MNLKSLLIRFGVAVGMLETAPRSQLDPNDLFIVTNADTFEGILTTSHDVLVKGAVHGGIVSPEKMVEIAEGGCMVGSILHADTIVWRGQLGSIKAICRTLIIEAGATSAEGGRAPGITYENLHINKCTSVSMRLHYAPYAAPLRQLDTPMETPRVSAPRQAWPGRVVALEQSSHHAVAGRHRGQK